MNTTLIQKYKKEFDYWLNGGEILSYNYFEKIWVLVELDSKIWETDHNYSFVINDNLVEYRKALEDKSKTVQYFFAFIIGESGWRDVDSLDQTRTGKGNFRFKPDFKNEDEVFDYMFKTKQNYLSVGASNHENSTEVAIFEFMKYNMAGKSMITVPYNSKTEFRVEYHLGSEAEEDRPSDLIKIFMLNKEFLR